jgi:hypothetical protein
MSLYQCRDGYGLLSLWWLASASTGYLMRLPNAALVASLHLRRLPRQVRTVEHTPGRVGRSREDTRLSL